jgi:hypothetical protein
MFSDLINITGSGGAKLFKATCRKVAARNLKQRKLRLREKSKFACDFSVIWAVQSRCEKYSA